MIVAVGEVVCFPSFSKCSTKELSGVWDDEEEEKKRGTEREGTMW